MCAKASKIDVVLAAPRSDQERVVHAALQRKLAAAADLQLVGAARAGSCTLSLEIAVDAVERAATSARVAISVTVYREPAHEKLGVIDKKLTAQDLKPEEMAAMEQRLLDTAGGTAADSFVPNARAFVAE